METVVYYEEDGSISRGNAYKSSVSVEAMSSSTVALRILVPTKHIFCFSFCPDS